MNTVGATSSTYLGTCTRRNAIENASANLIRSCPLFGMLYSSTCTECSQESLFTKVSMTNVFLCSALFLLVQLYTLMLVRAAHTLDHHGDDKVVMAAVECVGQAIDVISRYVWGKDSKTLCTISLFARIQIGLASATGMFNLLYIMRTPCLELTNQLSSHTSICYQLSNSPP